MSEPFIVISAFLGPSVCVMLLIGVLEIRRLINKHRYLKGNR
jgi:hypothetical protein